ncbi:PIR protein [Plasmodium vivax]|uniref:VIR protein n=1 Tax=Plasmodium vivax TaxID=5855 RepID=A0A565A4J7_PLAVI|nr:PIR protein [Plasmodium vivax]
MGAENEDSKHNYVDKFHKCKDNFNTVTSSSGRDNTTECNYIRSLFFDYSEFVVTCQKIVKYLTHITSSTDEDNLNENCTYLNYRLNYEIQKIIKNVEYTSQIYNEVIKGFTTYFDSKIKKCMGNMKHINSNELVELKKLIELHENFDNFLNDKYKTDDKHCIYGKKCVESYLTYIDDCYYDYDRTFCKLLEKFREDYNDEAERVINCQNVSRDLPPIKKGSKATAIMVPIFFTSLTIFSIVFLLYKFTSFQSWINPRIKKKKKY